MPPLCYILFSSTSIPLLISHYEETKQAVCAPDLFTVPYANLDDLSRILVTSQQPMFIGRATVQWVKGLECDLAFKRLPPREADRLQYLLDALLESGSYSGRPSAWLKVKPPLTSSRRAKNLVLARTPSSSSMCYRGTVVFPMLYGHSWSTGRKCE